MIINRTSKFLHTGIALTLALISACQVVPTSVDTSNKNDVTTLNTSLKAVSIGNVLSGIAQFPDANTKINLKNSDEITQSLKKFKVKATFADVANKATISLIYPDNDPVNANRTIATTLTDAAGAFTFTPPASFVPVNGQVLKLQAVRRVGAGTSGDGGIDALSVRTFIVWNTAMNAWTSVSAPTLVINAVTTALTIIQEKLSTIINPIDIIGKYNSNTTGVGAMTASAISKAKNQIVYQSFDVNFNNNDIYRTQTGTGLGDLNLTNFSSSDTNPSLSDDGTKVLFESERTGSFDVFIMNSDGTSGTNPFNLSNTTAVDTEPAISPDGKQVAYRSNRTGNEDIFITNSDGTNFATPLNLTATVGSNEKSPVWSPDSKFLAYVTDTGVKNIFSKGTSIGSNATNLTNSTANNYSPNWKAGFITFVSDRDGNPEIYVMPSTGSTTPTRLTTNTAIDATPVLSPDGTKVAYTSNVGTVEQIYTVPVSGGVPTQLTSAGANTNPSWSPDGTKITFQSNRDGNLDVYSMDANGNNQVNVSIFNTVDTVPKYGAIQEEVVTLATITNVATLVTNLLTQNYDPIHYIGLTNPANNTSFGVVNPVAIPLPLAPATPAVTSPTFNSANFSWDYVGRAETYKVFLNGTFVTEVDRDTNTYNFTNLIGNTSYIFGVQTVNGVGTSATTATVGSTVGTATVPALALLTRTGTPVTTVSNVMPNTANNGATYDALLTWTFPTGGAVNYRVIRLSPGTPTVFGVAPNPTANTTSTYQLTGLTPNTSYTFAVVGTNASGDSAQLPVTFTTTINTSTGGIIGNR